MKMIISSREERMSDINKLIENLENKNQIAPLRLLAIEKISEHENKMVALNAVVNALHDDDQDIRSYAAEVLGGFEDKEAVPPLIDALQDGFWEVREAALKSLALLEDSQSLPAIISRLKDENARVRYTAVAALRKFDDLSVIEPMYSALNDSEESVAKEAETALRFLKLSQKIPISMFEPYLDHPEINYREITVEILTFRVDGDPIPLLEKALKDTQDSIRFLAIQELAKVAQARNETHSKIIDICLSCLDDSFYRVRADAIDVLRELNAEKAIDALIDVSTKDDDEHVRFKAIDALTEIRRAVR